MKFIASLIACLTANKVLAQTTTKEAYCLNFPGFYNSGTRVLFDLYQSGPDDDVEVFKYNMLGTGIGHSGDKLIVNGFEFADC